MALTENTSIKRRGEQAIPVNVEYPVKAGQHIFAGSMVAIGGGFAYAVTASGPMYMVVGRAERECDNTAGADGALWCSIKQGIFCYTNSSTAPLTAADAGLVCWAEDDNTVGASDGSKMNPGAGIVYYVDAEGVWVYQSTIWSLVILGVSMLAAKPVFEVRGASTGNVANLAAFTVANDGITLVQGERVLLKNQGTASQNGIYDVGVVGGGTAPLTRSDDFNDQAEVVTGVVVVVSEGTANLDTAWALITNAPVVGTTSLDFAQVPFGYGTVLADVTKAAAAAGVSNLAARVDHKHDVSTGTPTGATGPAMTASEGSASSLARSDHNHPFAVPDAKGMSLPIVMRFPIVAGIGGAADDVAIYTADSPFNMRILDVFAIVATSPGVGSSVTLRDTVGGGGVALSDALSVAATGVSRNAAITASPVLASGSSLVVRRSDNTMAGEIVILAQRL